MHLLERGAQLGALAEYAVDAEAGRARLVLVAGEAGAGKSALVQAFRKTLPEARWLAGACDGLFTPRPLGPLRDVAEQTGGELAALCREPGAAREQLFWALLRELAGSDATPGGLTVLVVEDVHWADRATLDLVHFLSRRLERTRLLLLLTYRDEAGSSPDLTRLLGDLVTRGATRHVTVPPLSREAVATLTARSGLGPEELHRLTGGNPFFLTEVLAAAADRVPDSARAAVLSRVVGLSPPARRVLDGAALLGTRVELDLVHEVAGARADQLDELVANGVVRVDGAELGFRHEIARRAIADAVPAHRATGVHRRALDVLEHGGSADHARLAYHADGAGDARAVLAHAPVAAAAAARLGAHRQAAEQYERAVRHAAPGTTTGEDGRREHAGLLLLLLDELGLVDRWEEARAVGEEALRTWTDLDDPVGQAQTLGRLSKAFWRLGRGEEARGCARRSVDLLEPLGDGPDLAAALAVLAGVHMVAGENHEAIGLARRARELATTFRLPAVEADADNAEGAALGNLGLDWRPALDRSLRTALAHDLHDRAGRAYSNVGSMLQAELRLDEALATVAESLSYTQEHDVGTFSRCLRGGRLEILEQLGRWDEALAEGEELLAEPSSPENRLQACVVVGRIRCRRGLAGGRDLLEEAMGTATGTGDPQFVVPGQLALAEADWTAGNRDGAHERVLLAAAVADGVDPAVRGQVATWAARLDGIPDDARLAEVYAVQLTDPRAAAARWSALGCPYAAALALVDASDEASLRAAVDAMEDLGAVPPADRVRQLMREAGVRSVPVGARASTRSNPYGLTRREQDVLDRIVDGLGNAEIARALFITPKTVEHHVSHVLAKLGAADRHEAAAQVTAPVAKPRG